MWSQMWMATALVGFTLLVIWWFGFVIPWGHKTDIRYLKIGLVFFFILLGIFLIATIGLAVEDDDIRQTKLETISEE